MKDLKVGDKVWMGCYTSMGASSEGESTIEEVDYRYDEKTGSKYKVYKVGSDWFNEAGCCLNKDSMFYIEEMCPPSKPIYKKRIIDDKTAEIYSNYNPKAVNTILTDLQKEFKPKRKISKRYNKKSLTAEEKKVSRKTAKMKKELIQKYLDRGHDKEQAETMAMRILYIAGFSGPTFKD